MGFLWDFFAIARGFLWGFHGVLWYFHGIAMASLWDFHDVSSDISLGLVLGFPWIFPRVSLGILLGFHKVSMEPLWHFYGIPMGLFWVSFRVFMRFLLDVYAISRGFL